MNPFAESSSFEIAVAAPRRVTPRVFPLPDVRYATAVWKGGMLLATLYCDENRGKAQGTLWRCDLSDLSWSTLHDEIFDLPLRKEEEGEPSEGAAVATIYLTPDARTGEVVAEVAWGPAEKRRWLRVNDDLTTSRIEGTGFGSGWHFVTWERWNEGVVALSEHTDGRRRLLRADAASGGGWQPMEAPENSEQVSAITVFEGELHATVDDDRRGFTLWKLSLGAISTEALSWQPLLRLGAYRYLLNANVLGLVSHADALYVAAGRKATLPSESTLGVFTRADFELLRWSGKSQGWDVIVGQPRFTTDGLKVPISERGPGFHEREPMPECCLVETVSGLHLGMAGPQGLQLWKLDATDQWQEVFQGALLEYQRVVRPVAYPTAQGLMFVTECQEFAGRGTLEIWTVPV